MGSSYAGRTSLQTTKLRAAFVSEVAQLYNGAEE
jgi:hypothetical protein